MAMTQFKQAFNAPVTLVRLQKAGWGCGERLSSDGLDTAQAGSQRTGDANEVRMRWLGVWERRRSGLKRGVTARPILFLFPLVLLLQRSLVCLASK